MRLVSIHVFVFYFFAFENYLTKDAISNNAGGYFAKLNPALATAFQPPAQIMRLSAQLPIEKKHDKRHVSSRVILDGSTNGYNDILTEKENEKTSDNDEAPIANGAYSGLSNVWGYSRSVIKDRDRKLYERQRIRHKLKLEGKISPFWADIWEGSISGGLGAADAFLGKTKLNGSNLTAVTESAFDNDEDGYFRMLGGRRRGFVAGALRQLVKIPHRALFGEYRSVEPGTLILVRHGESIWNSNKTFTGWADPDLSPQGYREVEHAARLLLEGGYKVDVVFTSRLKRAIRSTWLLLRELNKVYLPVFKSWRLNERMYGALTGLSKTETAERLGAELVQEWRGSLRTRPPALTASDKYYPGRDRRHADLSPSQIPLTESLLDCMERTKPVWIDKISYELASGRNVLVVAHANTLRGLVKIIDDIGDDEIQDIAIPTGIPIVYKFNKKLQPIPPTNDQKTVTQVHMKGIFLEKPGLLKQAIKREQEWCANVPDYQKVMSRSTLSMTPLERSLTKLEAERKLKEWAGQFPDDSAVDEDDGTDGKLTLVEQDKVWEMGLQEVEEGEYFDPDHAAFKTEIKTSTTANDVVKANFFDANSYSPCVTAMPASSRVQSVPLKKDNLIVMIRHGKTENNKLGLFTGWDDVPLAKEGVEEAIKAGQLLKLHGFEFDVVYTSWLSRAIETAWYVMDEMDCLWLPIIKSWRLNERMYGGLTGLSKAMVKQRHGEKQFKAWRRGFSVRPPRVSSFSPQYPGNDDRYNKYLTDVRFSMSETLIRTIESRKLSIHRNLPKSESLKDCMDRTIPFFTDQIIPEAVNKGKRVLISSSENAIRGLLMHLCEIPEEKIAGLEIPNGLPLIFDLNSKCVKLLDDGSGKDPLEVYNFGSSASYLFKPCVNPDGTYDEECSIDFTPDIEIGETLSAEESSIIESIRRPTVMKA